MINRGTVDRLEDAIDEFEERWCPDSPSRIETLLSEYDLNKDHEAIAELIRIDIELRNQRGLPIEIDDYLNRFQILRDQPERIAEIAFEDFRSRSATGQTVSAQRWKKLPSVRAERWFQELVGGASRKRPSSQILRESSEPAFDSTFEEALNEAGFHLVHEIGEGSFSRVYLANQLSLADRFVVLKIVKDTLAEPEFMALLQHTNIVPIYSFHRILSKSVICMPYTGCVTLREFLLSRSSVTDRNGESLVSTVRDRIEDTKRRFDFADEDTLSSLPDLMIPAADEHASLQTMERFRSYDCHELALWIFERLAGALSHAHARGVIHNDLKPSNVLIRNDGEPALLDFNLSESLTRRSSRHIGGTLPYMSPEVYRGLMGGPLQPKAQSDIYSLGVILFEFITGRLPFPVPKSSAPIDLSPAHDARQLAPAWSPGDRVSPGLRSIVDRCLQFDDGHRYDAAENLRDDLHREQSSLSLAHAPEPWFSKTGKWRRRHPKLISTGLAATLLLGIGTPLAYRTVVSEAKYSALEATREFNRFEESSIAYLSSLMVDPKRDRKSKVDDGIKLLSDFDALSDRGLRKMLSVSRSTDSEASRDSILRHITHLGILEASRLSKLRVSDPDSSRDVRQLDQLISLAKQSEGSTPLRSRLFLEAQRAKLVGENDSYKRLFANATAAPIESDTDTYLEAVRLMSDGNYLKATELLESLADRGTVPSAVRWTTLGRAQFQNGEVRDALLSFTQSLERAPDSAALWILRGRCHYDLGQRPAALRDYKKAIELDPEARGAWSQMGMIHLAERSYDEALACFDRVLEISPNRIFALLKRSKVYEAMGQSELAEADFQTALDLDCDDDVELVYRAIARTVKDPEAAIADLREAIRLNPDRVILLRQMAHIFSVDLNQYEEAIELYSEAIDRQPDNEIGWIGRALAEIRLQRVQDALSDTRRAMQGSNSPKTCYQAACVHVMVFAQTKRNANRDRALGLLSEAIRKGYHANQLDTDPDLDSIRGTNEFKAIQRMFDLSEPRQRRSSGR